jgi:NAD dependent epimerase/dehydratase family enzyme
VQSTRGGVLRLLRPLVATGVAGKLGSGNQWMSWIDLDDLTDIYFRALGDPRVSGPVNAVAPDPVTNEQYVHTLASIMRRPAKLTVPTLGPRLLLGSEGANQLAFASQRVRPATLGALQHQFRRPDLERSLRHQLGRLADGAEH